MAPRRGSGSTGKWRVRTGRLQGRGGGARLSVCAAPADAADGPLSRAGFPARSAPQKRRPSHQPQPQPRPNAIPSHHPQHRPVPASSPPPRQLRHPYHPSRLDPGRAAPPHRQRQRHHAVIVVARGCRIRHLARRPRRILIPPHLSRQHLPGSSRQCALGSWQHTVPRFAICLCAPAPLRAIISPLLTSDF